MRTRRNVDKSLLIDDNVMTPIKRAVAGALPSEEL